eukprot:s1521_g15.t1
MPSYEFPATGRIILAFSEEVKSGPGEVTFYPRSVGSPKVTVHGRHSIIAGHFVMVDLMLLPGEVYNVSVDADAFLDLDGYSMESKDESYVFSTMPELRRSSESDRETDGNHALDVSIESWDDFTNKDCGHWKDPLLQVPGGRLAPSVTVDDVNRIFLLGGRTSPSSPLQGRALNDVWLLDTYKEVNCASAYEGETPCSRPRCEAGPNGVFTLGSQSFARYVWRPRSVLGTDCITSSGHRRSELGGVISMKSLQCPCPTCTSHPGPPEAPLPSDMLNECGAQPRSPWGRWGIKERPSWELRGMCVFSLRLQEHKNNQRRVAGGAAPSPSRAMAKSVTLSALGGLLGASYLSAFVTPAVKAPAPALRGVASSGDAGGVSSVTGAAATAVATAAVALVASRKSKKTSRALVQMCAEEKPFAGGLIGGESAFAGQDFNFDPLGLAVKCEKYLPWFREAELKHGRIAMLAFVGLVVPDFARIPGPEACYGAKNVVEAHNACAGDPYFPFVLDATDFYGKEGHQLGPLFQVFAFCGLVEMLTTFAKTSNVSNKPGLTLENAGDYRLGVNFLPQDEAKEMKLKELKNGRLAMLAFGGAITQATLTGNGFPWLYATGPETRQASTSSSVARSAGRGALAGAQQKSRSNVARKAEKGYKMSAAVPFLPMSPALEGIPGEEEGFDPMGFSLAIDIRWLREAELKHGRVAMLATVGWITTDLGLRVPGDAFQISTIEAHDAMVKFGSMPQILVWLGYLELFGFLAIINMQEGKTDRKPGDFGLRGFYPADAKGQYDMQLKELRNGRLAMLAFSGIATVGVLTQEKWPFFDAVVNAVPASHEARSALCGSAFTGRTLAVARHASSSKSMPFLPKPQNLGGLVGSEAEFDPLGFSDTFDIKWLRESELKHGRVCMLATIGFVAEQYIQFPGFTAAPDALQAIYTAPVNMTALLLFAAGYIESSTYNGKLTMLDMFEGEGAKRAPGDLNFGKRFLPQDKAQADELAMKELSNGRLAMLAFSGMVHHNLVVKGTLSRLPELPELPELG